MVSRSSIVTVGSCLLAGAVAAAEYAYDDDAASQRVLYVTVAENAEEVFDVSSLAPSGATVTNVVKRGDGTLFFNSTALKDYTFDTRVEDGVLKILNKETFSATPCAIDVCDGATLYTQDSGTWANYGGLTTRFRGSGHAGKGALYKDNYDWGSPFGGKLVQTGDAVVRELGVENSLGSLDMQHHALDVYFNKYLGTKWNSFSNVGSLNIIGSGKGVHAFPLVDWTNFGFDGQSAMSFSNAVFQIGFDARSLSGPLSAPLTFKTDSSLQMLANAGRYREGGTTYLWSGPVLIDEPVLPVSVSSDKGTGVGYAFTNKVSGGGLALAGNGTNTLVFTLASAANDFTGGVSAVNAELRAKAPGAVPAEGGPLAFTNSTFTAEEHAGTYALPSASFDGDCTVSNGFGRWQGTLAKTGSGTLTYKSSMGADTLDVRGGRVDMSSQASRSRTALSGVIEGHQHIVGVYDYSIYKTRAFDNNASYAMMDDWVNPARHHVFTNSVTRGMRLLYDHTRDYETGWSSNLVVTYSGYLWNNSSTNETWAFGASSCSEWVFKIDGNFIFGYCNWWGDHQFSPNGGIQTVSTNTYVMAPGPHYFEYRAYVRCTETGNMGPSMDGAWIEKSNREAGITDWKIDSGLMYNRTGRCTKKIADYAKLVDPGDGSLLTCALPGPDAPVQVGSTVIPSWRIAFAAAKFAPGTSADFGGQAMTFAQMTGWPTVENGDVTVNDSWTFNPLEIGTGAFAIDGKLNLGSDFKVVFPDGVKPPRGFRRRAVTLGTAAGGVEGAVKAVQGENWRAYVDGSSLKAIYFGEGALILLK